MKNKFVRIFIGLFLLPTTICPMARANKWILFSLQDKQIAEQKRLLLNGQQKYDLDNLLVRAINMIDIQQYSKQEQLVLNIQHYLRAGASPNAQEVQQDWSMYPILFSALGDSADLRIILDLAYAGADINIQTEDGLTGLMIATSTNNIEHVRILLQLGANPNALADSKIFPLPFHIDIAKHLKKTFKALDIAKAKKLFYQSLQNKSAFQREHEQKCDNIIEILEDCTAQEE